MSNREGIARHRAAITKTSSIAVIAKAVSDNAGGVGRQAAVIAAASGLVLTTGLAANAAQPTEVQPDTNTSTLEVQALAPAVTASSKVQISFQAPKTSSSVPVSEIAAPVIAAESNTTTPAAQTAEAAPAATTPAAQQAAAATTPAAQTAPAASTTAASTKTSTPQKSGIGATIAAAAYAQLGVAQDCTALASNSLAAAGIFYHGWPAGYLSLGRTISEGEAQPGDLIYYANGGGGQAHIAVYVGNGMAVHGGWNGYTTALFSAHVGSGPVFIAIGH
ncbi:cell wall-associated NlpC family hydrolase [Psychromicrobium silvestre]|uniref:Cell wall-associated NlpC family hydrolase n=1 Tax=Psychromicrobium silvestre TaxID=1645614 RepID=A0A7Y9LVG5_9MICC|nr:NlpC/P60 family protein [Psychromicrobium silvestre]NYE96353.1 cell wall-associated NlpC family hydrolase [Psychromicrobium silvestre]